MKWLSIFCVLFLIICISMCCKNVKKQTQVEDGFYTNTTSSWDAVRIPLIKPYELLELNGTNEWNMNMEETPSSASKIEGVNVLNKTIIIHSCETYCNNAKVQEAWFVIMPEKRIEKGFLEKKDFDKFLLTMNITNYEFYNPDAVYDSFSVSKKIVSWMPPK